MRWLARLVMLRNVGRLWNNVVTDSFLIFRFNLFVGNVELYLEFRAVANMFTYAFTRSHNMLLNFTCSIKQL